MSWKQTGKLRFLLKSDGTKILQERFVWRPNADIYVENPEHIWRDIPMVVEGHEEIPGWEGPWRTSPDAGDAE